jgi:hypothetical protein
MSPFYRFSEVKVKKTLTIAIIIIIVSSMTVVSVFAFPGVPFNGQASAKGIDVDLDVVFATVGIDVVSESTDAFGQANTAVETHGDSMGLNVSVLTGILNGVEVNLVDALTTKIYDGDMDIISDEEMLLNIDAVTSPLATTGIISSASQSQVTGLVGWSSTSGAVNNTNILSGIGSAPILSILDIYNFSGTETTADHTLNTYASSVLSDVEVRIPTLTGMVDVLSADIITSTANASNDGTMPNSAASSNVEFVNLVFGGTSIPVPTAGDVYTITSGIIPQNIARVTIMPILNNSTSATSSTAEAVSLYIEVLAGSTLAGTEITLAESRAESNAESVPTGPTVIKLHSSGSIDSSKKSLFPIIGSLIAGLALMSGFFFYQQRLERRLIEQANR